MNEEKNKCNICNSEYDITAVYHTVIDKPKAIYYCNKHLPEHLRKGKSPQEVQREYYKRLNRK